MVAEEEGGSMNGNIPRPQVYTCFERITHIATCLVALGLHPQVRCFRSHLRIEVEMLPHGPLWDLFRMVRKTADQVGVRTSLTYEDGIHRPMWIVVRKTSTGGPLSAPTSGRRQRVVVPASRDRRQAAALERRLDGVPDGATRD